MTGHVEQSRVKIGDGMEIIGYKDKAQMASIAGVEGQPGDNLGLCIKVEGYVEHERLRDALWMRIAPCTVTQQWRALLLPMLGALKRWLLFLSRNCRLRRRPGG